ncbi:MAG: cytochrome c family protein, partial [Sulfurimonas sp.]|uniref:multiheme c-type cytochrome n=1 Tax=Sulfurimonas sp. TaxID=2022749 RepID=UPI0025FC54C4
MKVILYILALGLALFANTADTATCHKCHPTIVEEFESSMHKKSSIYEDKIHKAVWDKHPSKEKNDYTCAKCHTPNATDEASQKEGITCISCHTITN